MRRSVRAGIVATALTLTALSSCGASGTGDDPAQERQRAAGADAEASGRGLALKRIGSFDTPVYVTAPPGEPDLLLVVEQGGEIEALRNGRRRGRFLDISGLVSFEGERGLLSAAFPPDHRRTGLFYVYYTDRQGDIRIDEFRRRSKTRASRGSRRAVIEIPHRENSNHNGGQAQFLGGLLYFGTGDGGSGGDPPENAQNRESLLGKILRIDPRASGGRPYSIPPGNPFAGGRRGRDEIFSYGLRNPFRFSFDTVTSPGRPRIAIADVGQDRFEEVDYTTVAAAQGANFGWDAFEGFAPFDDADRSPDPGGTTKPIFVYSRGRGCTIIGGYVVGDRRLRSLYRRYVYADFCEGRLRSLVPHLSRAGGDRALGLSVSTPSSFGVDSRGRLYVTSLEGPVFRLVPR
jgi:glucose/arabinose dehydrogenase